MYIIFDMMKRLCVTCLLAVFFYASPLFAQLVNFGDGYSVEPTAGSTDEAAPSKDATAKSNNSASVKNQFAFFSYDHELEFDVIAQPAGRFTSLDDALVKSLAQINPRLDVTQLKLDGNLDNFEYEGRPSYLVQVNFKLGNVTRQGYLLLIEVTQQKIVSLMATTSSANFVRYADFIFSSLDSFALDDASRARPGPISQYLTPLNSGNTTQKIVKFGEHDLIVDFNQAQADAEVETARREFHVLQAYMGTIGVWAKAWERMYRIVYRESAPRLKLVADEIVPLLPENDTDAARMVLEWVQAFKYERDLFGIDFIPPYRAAFEQRGDCDSRAMLLLMILQARHIDSRLLVSIEYNHALLAIDVAGGGQRIEIGAKQYLLAETTAKVGLGVIAADQADRSKWLAFKIIDNTETKK